MKFHKNDRVVVNQTYESDTLMDDADSLVGMEGTVVAHNEGVMFPVEVMLDHYLCPIFLSCLFNEDELDLL